MVDSAEPADARRVIVDEVGTSSECLAIVDAQGVCAYANPAARELLAPRMIAEVPKVVDDETLQVIRWPFVSAGRCLTAFSFHEAERAERVRCNK